MFNILNSYGIFTAETIPSKIGFPSVQISYRANQFDHRNLKIHLVPLVLFDSYDRLPFAYQYLEATEDRPYPIIKIIAGPGVNVVLENFPDPQDSFRSQIEGIPWVNVIRVQDPRVVPSLGTNIVSNNYVGKYEVGGFSSLSLGSGLPTVPIYREDYFVVETTPRETIIYNFYRNLKFIIGVSKYSYSLRDRANAYGRYAFQIRSLAETGGGHPFLTIVKGGNVDVEVSLIYEGDLDKDFAQYDPTILINLFECYETKNLSEIPPQGYEIVKRPNWQIAQIKFRTRDLFSEKELAQLGIDLAIGSIPIVGEVVDIAEFVYGVAYGEDKWGNKLSTTDLVIMGAAILLPFVSGAALRGGKRIARKFNNYAAQANESIEMLRKADLPEEALKSIEVADELIKKGKKVPKRLAETIEKHLAKLEKQSASLDDILC